MISELKQNGMGKMERSPMRMLGLEIPVSSWHFLYWALFNELMMSFRLSLDFWRGIGEVIDIDVMVVASVHGVVTQFKQDRVVVTTTQFMTPWKGTV
jgi:hypothetical protein